MSKNDKQKKSVALVKSGQDVSAPRKIDGNATSNLFRLYVARVGQIDLVHSVRTDKRKMFDEALDEARIALEVFENKPMAKAGIR